MSQEEKTIHLQVVAQSLTLSISLILACVASFLCDFGYSLLRNHTEALATQATLILAQTFSVLFIISHSREIT